MSIWRWSISTLCVALLSGCSGYAKTEHFEVLNDGSLTRFEVYDWLEEDPSGPSFGVYRPPVYGFEHNNQLYVVYPVFIRGSTPLLGPPLIPFLPIGDVANQEHAMALRVRHLARDNQAVVPTGIKVVGATGTTMPLREESFDEFGKIYSATLALLGSEPRFQMTLLLSDGSSRPLEFAHRVDRCYLPLFSFNGPNPKPSLKRYVD